MSKVAVFIGTTEGPVQVLRITKEPIPLSVVCLKRSSQELAISDAYDRFVRLGTGVIEREVEAGRFRLDLSAPIDEGESWQLGVFVAHVLATRGRLAGPDDEAPAALWLTGAVDNDLRVLPVAHLDTKLEASAGLFTHLEAAGTELALILPRGPVPGPASAAPGTVRTIDRAFEALTPFESEVRRPVAEGPKRPRSAASRPLRWVVIALVLTVLLGGATVGVQARHLILTWRAHFTAGELVELDRRLLASGDTGGPVQRLAASAFRTWLKWRAGGAEAVSVRLVERRPAAGDRTCAAVEFERRPPTRVPVSLADAATFETSALDDLCGLELRFETPAQRYVGARVDASGPLIFAPRPGPLGGQRPLGGPVVWEARIAPGARGPGRFDLLVIAGDIPLAGLVDAAETIAALRARAIRLGVAETALRYRVLP